MKKQLKDLDATPSKRIYLSIIADYHLTTALCELIDNSIDSHTVNKLEKILKVNIVLDYQQQSIVVTDNAGGIEEKDIKLIVSPGESRNDADAETIGIFGVGSKRAVIALSQRIRISSRHLTKKTLAIEIDDEWIKDPDWTIPVYEVDPISTGSTIINLDKLRDALNEEDHDRLINHFGATYALFIDSGKIEISVNGIPIKPVFFDQSWSYPPTFEPKNYLGNLTLDPLNIIEFDIIAGLTQQGDPAGGEYGVYFYCNNRLISRAYKGYEVGFRTGKAGQPHPSISLTRVIVKLKGKSTLMPWNSSKSEINTRSTTFRTILEYLEQIITNYARASRSMADEWNTKVFPFKTGEVNRVAIQELSSGSNLHLVPIPRKKSQKYIDIIKQNNKAIAEKKPWVKGTYEAIIAVEEISKLKIEQSNRISLLILDSTLEIAFKDYLVNESSKPYSAPRLATIMANRTDVHKEMQTLVKFKTDTWKKVNYFYNLRCELVHKKVAATVSDEDLENFRDLVEYMFKKMFKLNFSVN